MLLIDTWGGGYRCALVGVILGSNRCWWTSILSEKDKQSKWYVPGAFIQVNAPAQSKFSRLVRLIARWAYLSDA